MLDELLQLSYCPPPPTAGIMGVHCSVQLSHPFVCMEVGALQPVAPPPSSSPSLL